MTPALGHRVIVDRLTTYRIVRLSETNYLARLDSARRPLAERMAAVVDTRTLTWDAEAAAWRTDRCTPTR